MANPRLDGGHLPLARCDPYEAAVDAMLDARGPATAGFDPFARPPAKPRSQTRRDTPPPGGTYTLVRWEDGTRLVLRPRINAIGRFKENDIVLKPNQVSRRHCVVLVHVTGGCEVYDTASRNGTWVNRRRVGRVDLLPGDVLAITDQLFVVEWVGPDGRPLPPVEASDTSVVGFLPTGV